jgi:hypothetical protein
MFSIYFDGLHDEFSACDLDGYISCISVAIIIYADDILLLAPSTVVLQVLLQVSGNELSFFDTKISTEKTVRLLFGLAFEAICKHSYRYLGIYLLIYLVNGR